MFFLSKLIWVFLSPLNLLLIFLGLGYFFKIIKLKLVSSVFFIISLLFFIIVGIFPTGSFFLSELESKYPAMSNMPKEIDDKVAKYALQGMKINIDTQTQEQKDYGESYII